jgi:hypothetical protein
MSISTTLAMNDAVDAFHVINKLSSCHLTNLFLNQQFQRCSVFCGAARSHFGDAGNLLHSDIF